MDPLKKLCFFGRSIWAKDILNFVDFFFSFGDFPSPKVGYVSSLEGILSFSSLKKTMLRIQGLWHQKRWNPVSILCVPGGNSNGLHLDMLFWISEKSIIWFVSYINLYSVIAWSKTPVSKDKSSHYDVIFRSDNIRLGYFPHLAPASAGSLAVHEWNGMLDDEMLVVHDYSVALPATNIAPENGWLED